MVQFTQRRWLLLFIDFAVSVQTITFALLCYCKYKGVFVNFKMIPLSVHIVINVLLLISVISLYIGIFRLSNMFTVIGLLVMLFTLHALFAVILINYIDGGEEAQKMRRKNVMSSLFPTKTHRTVLFPGIWICLWVYVWTRTILFFITMQEFKKHPPFVRRSMHLMRAISSMGRDSSMDSRP